MNKLTINDIKGYLGTGLMVENGDGTIIKIEGDYESMLIKYFTDKYPKGLLQNIKPILRPLTSLTKEIVVEGYNEGKPFVPVKELGKIFGDKTIKEYHICGCYEATYGDDGFYFHSDDDGGSASFEIPYKIFTEVTDLLHTWQFWTGDQSLIGKLIIEKKD